MKSKNFLMIALMFGVFSAATLNAQAPKPGEQVDCVFKYKVDDKDVELKYDLFVPKNYTANKKFPLMLFLHGAGERGDDLNQVRKWGPPKLVKKRKDFPFIVISPQCPRDDWWTTKADALAKMVDEVAGKLSVDKKKMYCTGLSMGGYGTWTLCAKHPKLFAAAAPVCGGGTPKSAVALKNLPIWTFHGDADNVVPLSGTQKMIDAIKEAGGKNAKITIYKGVGHNSWSETYANEGLYKWLLSHSRGG